MREGIGAEEGREEDSGVRDLGNRRTKGDYAASSVRETKKANKGKQCVPHLAKTEEIQVT
jgi:hypothetical protein